MEVMGPAMRLARVAFQAAAHGDAGQVEKVRVVLTRAADEIEKLRETPRARSRKG
jgi:hypothetical protein